jgi:hypothetical protein
MAIFAHHREICARLRVVTKLIHLDDNSSE